MAQEVAKEQHQKVAEEVDQEQVEQHVAQQEEEQVAQQEEEQVAQQVPQQQEPVAQHVLGGHEAPGQGGSSNQQLFKGWQGGKAPKPIAGEDDKLELYQLIVDQQEGECN